MTPKSNQPDYSTVAQGVSMLPVIAVSADRSEGAPATGPNEFGRIRPERAKSYVYEPIVQHIRSFGAEVIILPAEPTDTQGLVDWVTRHCNAIVITGGAHDIHPSHYGQQVEGRLDRVDEGRTGLELTLAKAALERDIPCLGVCGGMQILAVAAGGTLIQDIKTFNPSALEHEQTTDPAEPWHTVAFEPGLVQKSYGCNIIRVNSTHHQAVDDPGPFLVTGRAPDGIVESIEHPELQCCVGVQWHPELIDPAPYRMISYFAAQNT